MQIIRTALWVLIAVIASVFVAINWDVVPINLIPSMVTGNGSNGSHIGVTGPLGVVILIAVLFGAVPTYLYGKAARWRLKRRIATLENTVKATTPTAPLATSTQFDAAEAEIGH
jgi:uncharacterized integral membrane protein